VAVTGPKQVGEVGGALRDRVTAFVRRRPGTARSLIAAVIAALTWPTVNRVVPTGLDPSWATALHLAVRDGLAWGRDLVFTYGPLGFLGVPDPWTGPSNAAALVAIGVVHVALCGVLLGSIARLLPLPAAALVTFLLAQTFLVADAFTLLTALVVVVCVDLLAGRVPEALSRYPAAVAAALGLVSAVALLGKLNAGMFIGAVGLVTAVAIGRPAWRAVAAFSFAVSGGGLALWLVAGGSLADLPGWLRASLEIVGGYSAVMGVDPNVSVEWRYLAFAALVGLIANQAIALGAAWPALRRWALLVVVGVVVFAMWKVGFVRWYSAYAFLVLAVLLVAVALPGRPPLATLAPWALAYVLILATTAIPAGRILDPRPALRTLRDSVAAVVSPSRLGEAVEAVQEQQRELYGIEPVILDALRGHSIHVDPTETAVLNAYPDLAWRPLPVFQSYSAYTPALDALNAAALRDPAGPDRILRSRPYIPEGGSDPVPVSIDGRFRWWDAPAAQLEMACRYEEVAATARWQVLGRTDRACGPPQPLATIESASGREVAVPAAPRGVFLILRITGLEPSVLEQVGTTLFKPQEWYAWLDGVRYRLVQTTARDGLLLAVPTDDKASPPFGFGPPIRTLRIGTGPIGTNTFIPLTFEFLSVARSS
jgi:hypothetical protein